MADSWWDSRTRPCLNSVSITSMNLFQETTYSTTTTVTCSGGGDRGGAGLLDGNPNLHMMELGLSSQPISQPLDWNQTLYRGDQRNDDHQSGYHTLIQGDHGLSSNTSNFQENQWKSHKMYSESPTEFKQINEHARYNNESRLNPGFQHMDHSYGSNSTIIQSLFGSDHSNTSLQQDSSYDHNYQNQGLSYSYPPSSYGAMTISGGGCGGGGGEYPPPPPQQKFSTHSPSKVQLNTQLHFSNDARFWNASAASMNDIRPSFFPLPMQSPSSTIEDKPKNPISEMVKISNTKSPSTKRPRNENPPLMPPLKARKEKMGDRITALQQLVSPFGKTDTASVLSEAIVYIKFLHEQVNVLSTPYMNNAAIMQQQKQILDKPLDGSRQDLRTRGLCLVPIASTFPVTNETPVDFWTPSFGGTFR
ncbi:uncharacterized protein LOC143618046 [Bidens hawaiensis]|uniref:uncharacterized protein LOC143618046 n=1 Tax=Bidens hawaiensis TaxID=980011 RepID=UPI00404983AB